MDTRRRRASPRGSNAMKRAEISTSKRSWRRKGRSRDAFADSGVVRTTLAPRCEYHTPVGAAPSTPPCGEKGGRRGIAATQSLDFAPISVRAAHHDIGAGARERGRANGLSHRAASPDPRPNTPRHRGRETGPRSSRDAPPPPFRDCRHWRRRRTHVGLCRAAPPLPSSTIACSVGASVVDENELEPSFVELGIAKRADVETPFFVVARHDDGERDHGCQYGAMRTGSAPAAVNSFRPGNARRRHAAASGDLSTAMIASWWG